jgi:23S rRNA (uracil1939-C5)-methyltransferase
MTKMEVTTDHIGARGDGVVETDKGPIYVPLTLPGETVTIELEDDRGRLVDIISASPDRQEPLCSHFGACGGCALQHQSEAAYRTWKQQQVIRSLNAQGIKVDVDEIVPCSPRTRRRATFGAMRTRKTVKFGFFERASHTIVDVSDCPVIAPEIERAMPILAKAIAPGLTRKGKASVAVTLTSSGLDVDVRGGKQDPDLALRETLGACAEAADLARLSWEGEIIAERRAPVLSLSGIDVALPPGAFLQATQEGEAHLVSMVADAIGSANSVVDLYAGCGTFSLALAKTRKVHAVEGAAAQCASLEAAVHRFGPGVGLKPLTVERRDLARRPLSSLDLNKFEAVVIDPPRAGAAAQMEDIAWSDVPTVASVSCNPATFARDARILIGGGYRLESVTPLDQFLWSPHIEMVGIFKKG